MWRTWLVVPIVLAACETEHRLPPPPPEAVASCVTEYVSAQDHASGTLWFNEQHQVFRVDGGFPYSDDDYGPAAFYFAYDAEGRLEERRSPGEETHYAYSPQEIMLTSSLGFDWIFTLDAGRVAHVDGPVVRELNRHSESSYAYDTAGRITQWSGVTFYDLGSGPEPSPWDLHYTYDDHDRVTAVTTSHGAWTLTYMETPDRLVVTVDQTQYGETVPFQRATYDFDANHRIIRSAREDLSPSGGDYAMTYRYEDGVIEGTLGTVTYRATGDCEPPTLRFGPQLPLPLRWSANTISLPDPTDWFSELY
jgi:YD repeat-containing protein